MHIEVSMMMIMLIDLCVAGPFHMHHVPGCCARLMHHAAHPEAQHDGVSCWRRLGESARAVLPSQPMFLHGDL